MPEYAPVKKDRSDFPKENSSEDSGRVNRRGSVIGLAPVGHLLRHALNAVLREEGRKGTNYSAPGRRFRARLGEAGFPLTATVRFGWLLADPTVRTTG
jgi:hypothetical protein